MCKHIETSIKNFDEYLKGQAAGEAEDPTGLEQASEDYQRGFDIGYQWAQICTQLSERRMH